MNLTLPPNVAVFGGGPSNVPDLIDMSSVPPYRIAMNASAFVQGLTPTAVSACDFEALDAFGRLPASILVIHSCPEYRGRFQYELYGERYPGWFTVANLLFTIAQYGVKAVHFIGFDSWSYTEADYQRLWESNRFYSEGIDAVSVEHPWAKRRTDPNPYRTINQQLHAALAHTGITGFFRHLDPTLWKSDQMPDNCLDNQTGVIRVGACKVFPEQAGVKPI